MSNQKTQKTTNHLSGTHCSSLKPVSELTDDEQFTIAFNAGVPIKEMVQTADGFKMVLMPSVISIIDNQYVVAWHHLYNKQLD